MNIHCKILWSHSHMREVHCKHSQCKFVLSTSQNQVSLLDHFHGILTISLPQFLLQKQNSFIWLTPVFCLLQCQIRSSDMKQRRYEPPLPSAEKISKTFVWLHDFVTFKDKCLPLWKEPQRMLSLERNWWAITDEVNWLTLHVFTRRL